MVESLGLIALLVACGWRAADALHQDATGSIRRPLLGVLGVLALWAGAQLGLRLDGPALDGPAETWVRLAALAMPCIVLLEARAKAPRLWPTGCVGAALLMAMGIFEGLLPLTEFVRIGLWALASGYVVASLRQAPYEGGRPRWGLGQRRGAWALAVCVAAGLQLTIGPGRGDPTPLVLGIGALAGHPWRTRARRLKKVSLGRRELLDRLDVGLIVADARGRVVDANRAASRLLGVKHLGGRSLEDLLAEARTVTDRALDVQALSLHGSEGRAALIVDRTEQRESERRLRLAARLQSIGTLTAGVAHEINNPLAFVRANLAQLEKLAFYVAAEEARHALPADIEVLAREMPELVVETIDGVDRIANVVGQLSHFARNEPRQLASTPVCMPLVAERAAAMARASFGRDVFLVQATRVPDVHGDEGALVQIVLDLLLNAAEAGLRLQGEAPRPVDVEGEDLPAYVELSVGRAPEGGVVLTVADRGPGIPEDQLARIFDPFFTTKPVGQGAGLGLSVAYDLTRRHGGRLEARPRDGGGMIFRLWLPDSVTKAA